MTLQLPARPAMFAGLGAVSLLLAWQLGAYQARQNVEVDNQAVLASLRAAEADVARLRQERDVSRAAETVLRDRLSEATRIAADERAELELYRRLSEVSRPVGLGVDRLRYLPGDDSAVDGMLEITLVQSRGRDRVAGTAEILLKRGAETLQLPQLTPQRFDLRFFQTLALPLDLDAVGVPDTATVVIRPDDERLEAVTVERAWTAVAE